MNTFSDWFARFAALAALVLVSVGLSGGPAFAGDPPASPAKGAGEDGAKPVDPDEEEDEIPLQLNDKITRAVEKGVQWLKNRQLPDGSWGAIEGNKSYGGGSGTPYNHPAGSAALALYTLLKCKVPLDDPVVKKGFNFLRSKYRIPGSSYECAMSLLAVTATADPFKKAKASQAAEGKIQFPSGDWREWATKLQSALLEKRRKSKTLGWRYQVDPGNVSHGGNQDLSSTQLVALAFLAAERCGIKTESKVWGDMIKFSMAQQDTDGPEWDRAVYDRRPKDAEKKPPSDADRERYGPAAAPGGKPIKDRARGFAYIKSDKLPPDEGKPTGGMTACGVGVIMIARYVLMKRDDETWKAQDAKAIQQSVYDGCAWLDANYSPFENPQKKNENVYHMFYLYAVERAFDLINNRLLGKHVWYEDMAQQIVGRQAEKGFWNSNSTHKPEEVIDTCAALLFLKRSTKGGIPYGSITGGGDEPPTDNRGR
jgi:hypothetical protein